MKKLVFVVLSALALTGALAFAPAAIAQTPAPSCSLAMQTLTAAQQKAVATQADVDKIRAAQTTLDAAVVAAEKALAAETDPLKIPALQTALTLAKNLAGAGNDKLQAAITADAAADAAVVAAQAAADRACRGADGTVTTVTTTPPPPAPVIIRIPTAINTGRA